jgi:hypothetical protein
MQRQASCFLSNEKEFNQDILKIVEGPLGQGKETNGMVHWRGS